MLVHLSVQNLALIRALDIDYKGGLTVITGETGAGKSIALDALGLCLGGRAEASLVRKGASKADVCATFDVSSMAHVKQWLIDRELLDADTAIDDIVLRRTVSAEGRSKAYISGTPASVQQLKELGQKLISIHGQHAHQKLLKADAQRSILDNFARHTPLLTLVKEQFNRLKVSKTQLQSLKNEQEQRADRRNLLEYQVQELDEFSVGLAEYETLELEHKKLSNSQALLEHAQRGCHLLYDADDGNALGYVQNATQSLTELQSHDPALAPIVSLLNETLINIDEAASQLREYSDTLEIDPMKMHQVEQRFSTLLELARKHNVSPAKLYDLHQTLATELSNIDQSNEDMENLESHCRMLATEYQASAKKLSVSRSKAAKLLSKEVENYLAEMNMSDAKFDVEVTFDCDGSASSLGLDTISFKIATNSGIAPDTIEKVVSGGELSRLGLALQVIGSDGAQLPTMIFDEVDTGISGPTASVVGKLLRKLGESCQVMCVTHLPQVAACGHQQMFVTKFVDKGVTETHMMDLNKNERIEELARLLAGDTLTDSAVANAKEMLFGSQ